MLELMKLGMICLTLLAVVLPVAVLVAISLPHTSEFRRALMRVVYVGCALASVAYFGSPVDFCPDVLFPVGFADDAVALYLGYLSMRKAIKPTDRLAIRD